MEQIVDKALGSWSAVVTRMRRTLASMRPGSDARPVGKVKMFLEDIRARGFQPRGIIDVGANRGKWTSLALSVFPRADVIMIEPLEEMKPFLERLCEKNSRVEFVQAGAGREPGTLVQTIWDDLDGSSFLPAVSEISLRGGKQRFTKMVTIDDVLKERPAFIPDLVKLDVQGFELEALMGASSIFGQTEVFILETSLFRFTPGMPVSLDCLQFMHERGYELYDVTECARRPCDGALGQMDMAFARAGGTLRNRDGWSA